MIMLIGPPKILHYFIKIKIITRSYNILVLLTACQKKKVKLYIILTAFQNIDG